MRACVFYRYAVQGQMSGVRDGTCEAGHIVVVTNMKLAGNLDQSCFHRVGAGVKS